MAASIGNRSATVRFLAPRRLVRLDYRILIQTRFTSAWASRRFAAMSRMATAFTDRLTAARPGSTSGSKTRDRSHAFAFIRRILTSFTWRPRDMYGRPILIAAFLDQKTAARPGRKSCFVVTKPALAI